VAEQDASGSLAARLEGEFREHGVEPPRFLGLLAGIDPRFAASCLGLAARPWKPHVLEPKVEQFIRLAMNVSVTQLDERGSRAAIRNALQAGATPGEIVEVLELVAVLGIHTQSLAAPILIESLGAAGVSVAEDLTPRQVALRERYISQRGVWSPPWDAMLTLDPDFLEAYLEFSLGPFRDGGVLEPKVKEFVWIAVDASTSHLHAIGTRGHIEGALAKGASRDEIAEVLQIVTSIGLHSLDLGLRLLAEETAYG